MIIKTKEEEEIIKKACEISVEILKQLGNLIKEGITPLELDIVAGKLCKENNVKPAFKTVAGYKFNTCISINDIAVHGIPKNIPIKKGDIVLCPDGAGTYRVGEVTGDYFYSPGGILPHRRPVHWLSQTISRAEMSDPLKNSTGSIGTVSEISGYVEEIERLIGGACAPRRSHARFRPDPR